MDKAEEIVGVVLPANEDPALPLNLTFCAIFARLYPSPIYSPREHTLVCWSKPTCWTHRRTLEGQAEWQYQRSTAENSVRRIKGIKGVSNLIQLKPHAQPAEIKRKIQEAFRRNAEVDANRITVEARGGEVILKGTVRSWIEREEAERTAWAAPGVTKVEDRIVVSP